MKKRTSLALISVGIGIFVFGFFLTFFWTERNATRGDYIVKADTMLKISWHLDSSDRVEEVLQLAADMKS